MRACERASVHGALATQDGWMLDNMMPFQSLNILNEKGQSSAVAIETMGC